VTARIAAVFLGLVTLVLLAVAVPLAAGDARARTQTLVLDRTGDAARLARLAAPALARQDVAALGPEVDAYGDLYGIRVEVYDRDGELLLSSAPGAAPRAPREVLGQALAGRRSASSPPVLPWGPDTVAVAEPVLRGTDVAGAVVTVTPTGRVRADVRDVWLLLVLAGLGVLALAALVTVPLSRWILRPVRRLDDAVHALAEGDLGAHAEPGHGPPELRRLIGDFNLMARAVRTSSDQQRALVADASHQLRNPLTALRLRVDALETVVSPAALPEHRLAVEEIERLTRVLDDTLALARAQEAGEEPVAVDVRECARARLRAWSDAAGRVDTVMLLDAERPCWVLAPRGALEQVFDALVHNALRFTPGGTVTVAVAEAGAGEVEVTVADDGPGLTAEQCVAAVRRFWRGPDQQNVPGSGLGLAIASTLVERCGGRLTVAPRVPRGLAVTVRLPRLTAADAQPTPGLLAR
jgi:signal transduction histidine kinase